MPTYQYACTACDERLEAVQSFTDAPLTECPACSGRLRKVFSAVGVVFKGSGFYKTDSRSGSTAAKSDSKGESKSDSKGEAKSETAAAGSTSSSTSTSGSSGSSSKSSAAPAPSAPASKTA